MAYNSSFVSAARLTAVSRVAYEDLTKQDPLAPWFPTAANETLEYSFDRRVRGLEDMAEYRAFDAENALGRGIGGAKVSGKLPPLGRRHRITELEQAQFWTEQVKQRRTVERLEYFAADSGVAIARRLAKARLDAFLTGKIHIGENGVYADVDFGRDPALTITLATANRWSAAAAKPIADIEAWVDLMRETSDVEPTVMWMSNNVMEALRTNLTMRELAFMGAAIVPQQISRDDVVRVITTNTYITEVHNATHLYSRAKLGLTKPWPDSMVLLTDMYGADFGQTQFGVPVQATDPQFGLGSSLAGIMTYAYSEDNHFGLWANTEAIALPVMSAVDRVLSAKVLA